MNTEAAETKLISARTQLLLDKPFLGVLCLRLPLVASTAQWCLSTATDARQLFYNPEYINALKPAQVQFVLAHEALHCALAHFARREHRVKARWDLACDLAIHPVLLAEGLQAPPGVWIDEGFAGMTAEEIYPFIEDLPEQGRMDRHLYDESPQQTPPSEQPPPLPLNAAEREQLMMQWQQHLASAAQRALQANKLSSGLARLVDRLLAPRLSWRSLLHQYINQRAREDYSYQRPSRREGRAIFPCLRSAQLDLAIAIDVSGSISDVEICQYLSEVNYIKQQCVTRLQLFACDAQLAPESPWLFESWESCQLPLQIHGGGGTSFIPVFEYLARQDRCPDVLVYFTDGQGHCPSYPPTYPVIWLLKGQAKMPWGTQIYWD